MKCDWLFIVGCFGDSEIPIVFLGIMPIGRCRSLGSSCELMTIEKSCRSLQRFNEANWDCKSQIICSGDMPFGTWRPAGYLFHYFPVLIF